MSRKKCKKTVCPPSERWAVPMADFFSLLLALFIALYALASVNKEKLRAIKEEFVKIYDYAPVPQELNPVIIMDPESTEKPSVRSSGSVPITSGGAVLESNPDTSSEKNEDSSSKDEQLQKVSLGEGALDQSADGVLLKLPATIPFRGSNATLDDEEMYRFVKRVSDIIKTLPDTVEVSVRGYTDNQPIPRGSLYRDNLELSAARAATVVRELIRNGVSPERISSAGFGASKPLVDNNNESNRAKNRRVEFYMFVANDKKLDKATQKSVLDSMAKLPK